MSMFTMQGIETGILHPLRNSHGQDQRPCPLLPRQRLNCAYSKPDAKGQRATLHPRRAETNKAQTFGPGLG
jgi:hypothetical protein